MVAGSSRREVGAGEELLWEVELLWGVELLWEVEQSAALAT